MASSLPLKRLGRPSVDPDGYHITLTIRVTSAQLAWLQAEAAREEIPVSILVRKMITRSMRGQADGGRT